MTYPAPPARAGMPTWAKWTLGGCGGCLLVTVLGFGGCMAVFWQTFGKHMKMVDVSDKPDAPLTAAVSQLLPPRVGPFVRQSARRYTQSPGDMAPGSGWQGSYTSNRKRVQLYVT